LKIRDFRRPNRNATRLERCKLAADFRRNFYFHRRRWDHDLKINFRRSSSTTTNPEPGGRGPPAVEIRIDATDRSIQYCHIFTRSSQRVTCKCQFSNNSPRQISTKRLVSCSTKTEEFFKSLLTRQRAILSEFISLEKQCRTVFSTGEEMCNLWFSGWKMWKCDAVAYRYAKIRRWQSKVGERMNALIYLLMPCV
jgi:hypothetical protein